MVIMAQSMASTCSAGPVTVTSPGVTFMVSVSMTRDSPSAPGETSPSKTVRTSMVRRI